MKDFKTQDVKWQALEKGEICDSNLGLPKECDTLNLLVDGQIKISIDCKGQPFYFVRHFCFFTLNSGLIEDFLEYHIGCNNLEYTYSPKTGEVICFGDAKT